MPTQATDIWKAWLLEQRFRGDAALMQRVLADFLYPIRDRVLDNARLQDGETLLDVGCGDGLIGFGALERAPGGRVIFADISRPLLDHAAALAQQMGVSERCDFVEAPADDIRPDADASVDVVTTRSVLIYVADKGRAVGEFYRVLRPGGRVSLFEPINRFNAERPRHTFMGYDVTPVLDVTDKLVALYEALQPRETDPMVNFDERDLMRAADAAGFDEIRLDLTLEIRPDARRLSWDDLMRVPPNPKVPSLSDAMAQVLTTDEQERLVAHLRPLVEAGAGRQRSAVAYMTAVKR